MSLEIILLYKKLHELQVKLKILFKNFRNLGCDEYIHHIWSSMLDTKMCNDCSEIYVQLNYMYK